MRVGLESPSSFEGPGTSCSARVRIVLPRPSAAMSIRKRSLSSSMNAPPTSKYSHQVAILCPSKYTKMQVIASDFSKIFRGACPRTPKRGSGFAQVFTVCTQVAWCLEISLHIGFKWPTDQQEQGYYLLACHTPYIGLRS